MKTSKTMTNLEIADLLRAVAATYQLQDEVKNRYKIIAYERAADAVEHLSSETKDIFDEGKLAEIPGIGEAIASHLSDIFNTGYSKHFNSLMRNIPQQVFELMDLPRIGPKTAIKLVKYLKMEKSKNVLADLEKLAQKGEIAKIEGFGQESQADILRALEEKRKMIKRHLLPYAYQIAQDYLDWLRKDKNVHEAEALGSLRRMASTVGDIDIAVATKAPLRVIQRFISYKKVLRVSEKGEKTASVILPGGVQVDLMTQTPDSFGSLLQHFTGSKHHNIALREHSQKQDLSLSEYGIRKTKNPNSAIQKFSEEKALYNYLGMDYIPPELREDSGEIEAALSRNIPQLVQLEDIKGDLQIHSDFNTETSHDLGDSSIEEIICQAEKLDYQYFALTEHNPSHSGHNSQNICEILKRKNEYVDKYNYSLSKDKTNRVIYIFNSLEIDILSNGELAIPEAAFKYLDFALVSIHSGFQQTKDKATQRILQALSQPKVKILAHPSGRLLNKREGIEVDWPKVFAYCQQQNKILEINADPSRLDLPDFLVKEAISQGVKISLGTDSHHFSSLENMIWGVNVARRGWCQKSDIINTLDLADLKSLLLN